MKISNKAIVGCVGCLTVGLVSYLLNAPNCLWALILVVYLVDSIRD